jgi:hypothetical protein
MIVLKFTKLENLQFFSGKITAEAEIRKIGPWRSARLWLASTSPARCSAGGILSGSEVEAKQRGFSPGSKKSLCMVAETGVVLKSGSRNF